MRLQEAIEKIGSARLTEALKEVEANCLTKPLAVADYDRLAKALKEAETNHLTKPLAITDFDHLTKAFKDAGVVQPRSPGSPVVSKASDVTKAAKTGQRAIKYANPSSALRKHVARAEPSSKPKAGSVIRLPAPKIRTAHTTVAPPVDPLKPPTVAVPSHPMKTVSITSRTSSVPTALRTPVDLGDVVRRARLNRRLSQSELATAAGTGRRFISELEAGKPTLEFGRLLSVCNALGLQLLASASTDDQ